MLEFKDGILVSCPLPFVIALIPKDNNTSRSQLGLISDSITIHNFGDDNKPTAEQVADWIDKAYDRYSSWHFTIGLYKGKLTIIQKLPIDEVAWAAGDGKNGPGNRTSLHIECEETKEAEEFMIKFLQLLSKYLNITKIVPHKHWTDKYCPRMILPNWKEFIRKVNGEIMLTSKEKQTILKKTGDYKGPIDGDFGPNSKKARDAFADRELEKLHNLENVPQDIVAEFNILKNRVAALEKKH